MAKPNQNSTMFEIKQYIRKNQLNHPRLKLSQRKPELISGLKSLNHWDDATAIIKKKRVKKTVVVKPPFKIDKSKQSKQTPSKVVIDESKKPESNTMKIKPRNFFAVGKEYKDIRYKYDHTMEKKIKIIKRTKKFITFDYYEYGKLRSENNRRWVDIIDGSEHLSYPFMMSSRSLVTDESKKPASNTMKIKPKPAKPPPAQKVVDGVDLIIGDTYLLRRSPANPYEFEGILVRINKKTISILEDIRSTPTLIKRELIIKRLGGTNYNKTLGEYYKRTYVNKPERTSAPSNLFAVGQKYQSEPEDGSTIIKVVKRTKNYIYFTTSDDDDVELLRRYVGGPWLDADVGKGEYLRYPFFINAKEDLFNKIDTRLIPISDYSKMITLLKKLGYKGPGSAQSAITAKQYPQRTKKLIPLGKEQEKFEKTREDKRTIKESIEYVKKYKELQKKIKIVYADNETPKQITEDEKELLKLIQIDIDSWD